MYEKIKRPGQIRIKDSREIEDLVETHTLQSILPSCSLDNDTMTCCRGGIRVYSSTISCRCPVLP